MKGNDKQGIQHADRETNELHAGGEAGEDQTFGSGEGTAYTLYLIDQWFSVKEILPPREQHLAMSGDVFDYHD